jgi:hypothetical protein
LRETPACGGSEDDYIKHRSSRRIGRRQETRSLLDLGAGVGVDLEPNRNFDDDRRLPLHGFLLALILAA